MGGQRIPCCRTAAEFYGRGAASIRRMSLTVWAGSLWRSQRQMTPICTQKCMPPRSSRETLHNGGGEVNESFHPIKIIVLWSSVRLGFRVTGRVLGALYAWKMCRSVLCQSKCRCRAWQALTFYRSELAAQIADGGIFSACDCDSINSRFRSTG
eukprot:COSAG01_NODE_13781_length_1536_cov_20.329854_2_plen_154_part_00